jgi:hypothetical protein
LHTGILYIVDKTNFKKLKFIKMKTFNAGMIVAALLWLSFSGCEKEINKPIITPIMPAPSPHATEVVISSVWFPANWQQGEIAKFDMHVTELSSDLLKDGKVLIFGRGGFEMRNATALPASFDANYIEVKAEAGNLKFVLEGGSAISNSLKFRYILIPADKLVSANNLDYLDYHAICSLYKISE